MRRRHLLTYYPDLNEFKKLAKQGNLIPVYREIFADTETPVSAFKKLNTVEPLLPAWKRRRRRKVGTVQLPWFQSVIIFKSKGRMVEVIRGRNAKHWTRMIAGNAKEIMKAYSPVEVRDCRRFFGGAVGYISLRIMVQDFLKELPASTERWSWLVWRISDDYGDSLLIFDN